MIKIPKEFRLKLINGQVCIIVLENARIIDNGRTVSAQVKISKELLKSKLNDCIEFRFE